MGHKVGGVAGRPMFVVDRCATSLRRMESLCQQLARQLLEQGFMPRVYSRTPYICPLYDLFISRPAGCAPSQARLVVQRARQRGCCLLP